LMLQKQHLYESVIYLILSRQWPKICSSKTINSSRFRTFDTLLRLIETYVIDIVIRATTSHDSKYAYVISVTPVFLQEDAISHTCLEIEQFEACLARPFQVN